MAILVAVVVAGCSVRSVAQDTRDLPAQTAITEARRALNEGRYAEVESLLAGGGGSTERAVLRARAAAAIGDDDKAESLLRAAASADAAGDAVLELGLLHLRRGRRADAERVLRPLVESPDLRTAAGLLRTGRAAHALGEWEAANELFRLAVERSPEQAETQIAWGGLFLEKHNRDEAKRSFEAATRADSRSVDAWLGLARVLSDEDLSGALAAVRRSLAINSSSVEAHVVMADLLLDAGYDAAAREALRRALAVNARNLEAHAGLAAIARLQNRTADFEAAIKRALAIHPSYGEGYRIVARRLSAQYRFDEALALSREAVRLDPANSRARSELGMNLLRTGDEDEAREVLQRAFEDDPYDLVTYNLLAVLDSLEKFETIRDGDLVLRLDPREAAVLREPVLAVANEALRTLSARYGFTPRGPIVIEVFPDHDDFAVRNLGIPGLVGALGACFGRVVTMDSPRARPPGTFEWAATLWHELAHVVTLQMSAQRVPRWLTEGISVYEEQRARPEWKRPMDAAFARALDSRMVPALGDIDASFTNPRAISIAYYHAGLVVRYLNETYGQAKLNALVRAFADGRDEDAAFANALGASLEQVQRGFAQSVDKWFGPIRRALRAPAVAPGQSMHVEQLEKLAAASPESYEVQMALGAALRQAGEMERARVAYERAAELLPTATWGDSPHAALAEIALERGDRGRALAHLEKQLALEPVNIELARRLSDLLPPEDTPARRQQVYARIVALDPFDADAQVALGRAAAKQGDSQAAVRAFRAAVAAGVGDLATARCDLAEAYLMASDRAGARREVLAVLEEAPTFERALELLLKLVEGGL